MAETVFLHVGAPKTGTSYLQLLLWHNEKSLEAQGVFLPLGKRRAQFDAVGDLRGGMWADPEGSASWADLVREVASRPGRALVSEELLCATPPEQIRTAVESLAPADVHVICGFRDLARQVPAEWQQAVRARSAMDYVTWLDALRDDPERPFWQVQDPVRVASRWATVLPRENIHVLTVPPAGSSASLLWERFASVVGIDPTRAEAPDRRQNESLGCAESELLRRINGRLGDSLPLRRPYLSVVRDHLLRPGLMGSDGTRVGVPAEHQEWIRERSAEIATDLEGLGVDIVGNAGDLVSTEFVGDATPGDLTDSELLETSLEVWVKVLRHLETDVVQARGRIAKRQRRQVADLRMQVAELRAELDAVKGSRAFKIARRVGRRLPRG